MALPGSIPACAGEPTIALYPIPNGAVYPRVCGGTLANLSAVARRWGLSPRVRGNPSALIRASWSSRSIPACAGEPDSRPGPKRDDEVYPRVCGGTRLATRPKTRRRGLSPRVRGNLAECSAIPLQLGSIPACAGEPRSASSSLGSSGVYPRVCGGTSCSNAVWSTALGLSPRVRGNLCRLWFCRYAPRSIPACAGEPPFRGGGY